MSVKTFTRRDGRIVTVSRASGKRVVSVQTVFQSNELSAPTVLTKGEPGLGDKLAGILSAVGITPERYVKFKGWLGLSPQCGCEKRRAMLNRWGRRS